MWVIARTIGFLAILFAAAPGWAQSHNGLLPHEREIVIPESSLDKTAPDEIPDPKESMARTQETLAKLPRQVQDDLLREGAKAKDYCEYNTLLSNFYDCDCYSLKFVDARIREGDKLPFFDLSTKVEVKECLAPSTIMGYAYGRCYQTMYAEKMADAQLTEMCRCVGRQVASKYMDRPMPDIYYIDRMFSDTLKVCRYTP